jgi:Holliday junction DNA helicase RuvA
MIAHLTGTILFVRENHLVLDVHGVGYKVHSTQCALEHAQTVRELAFHVHTVVREDALELFGFLTQEELDLFQMLIGISGIGPRSALGIIGLETPERLVHAIARGDVGYLTKVSGVGKKSAEKIVLELRDKVTTLTLSSAGETHHGDSDVLEALQALGYRALEAREVLRHIPEELTDQGDRIKEALRLLSGR